MNKKEDINSITNDLKNVLLKAKKEIKQHRDELKKTQSIHALTKKEYQALYNENAQLKKKLAQYEEYVKSQNIQIKRNERDRIEKEKKDLESYSKRRKQMEEISILDEIKMLKKLDLESLLTKRKKAETIAKAKKKKKSQK